MSDYKKMLAEKIETESELSWCAINVIEKKPHYRTIYKEGANLLAPMLLEAIEKLEYVSLHLEDGYIVDEVLRKFEEFCK